MARRLRSAEPYPAKVFSRTSSGDHAWSCAHCESPISAAGHLQRGGSPTNFDRALCSIFGVEAVGLIADGDFGHMVAYQGSQVNAVKISDPIGRFKTVRLDGGLTRTARALGICLGE